MIKTQFVFIFMRDYSQQVTSVFINLLTSGGRQPLGDPDTNRTEY